MRGPRQGMHATKVVGSAEGMGRLELCAAVAFPVRAVEDGVLPGSGCALWLGEFQLRTIVAHKQFRALQALAVPDAHIQR